MPATSVEVRAPSAQVVLPALIAALACSVSVVLTVRFCLALRGDQSMGAGLIAAAIGLSWELAKYHFGPVGIRALFSPQTRNRLRGLGLCAVNLALVAGSIAASLGYLLELDASRTRSAAQASYRFRDARTELGALDAQIAALTQTASADAQRHFRTRALSTLDQVEALRAQRAQVADRLDAWEATPALLAGDGGGGGGGGGDGVFAALAGAVVGSGSSTELAAVAAKIRFASHALVALMLEVLGLVALTILYAERRMQRRPSGPQMQPTQMRPTQMRPTQMRPDASKRKPSRRASDPRYATARAQVRAGRVQPSYRALQGALRVGQQNAQSFLRSMLAEGLLRRHGRRYVLAEAGAV